MKFVPKGVSRRVGRTVLKTKANSPHLFFVAGVAGTVVSTVLACRATLRLHDTLDVIQSDVEAAKLQDDSGKATSKVYVGAGLKLVKLYGPAVLVGTASIGALTGSHVQLTRRNTALMAAYAAVQKAYDDYRERVKEQLGEGRELDIYHNATDAPGKGADKVANPDGWSPYARFFDEASPNWVKDAELNLLFVECQQRYLNHVLISRGHVFLNEVYDALGIERSRAGAVVGWVHPSDKGDGYISFGIYEARNARFVNGTERSILLDFNVDGVIYDLI